MTEGRPRAVFRALGLVLVAAVCGGATATVFGIRMGDTPRYLRLATNLAEGHGFSAATQAPFSPEVFRAPLYPHFLGMLMRLGLEERGVSAVQLGLFSIAVLIVFSLGLKLADETSALAGALLLATYLPIVRWVVAIGTESLVILFSALLAWIIERHLRSPRPGSAIALAVVLVALFLTRPEYAVLLLATPALLAFSARGKNERWLAGLVLLVSLMGVAPWVARNLRVIDGEFRPLGVGGGMTLFVRSVELSYPDAATEIVESDTDMRKLHESSDVAELVATDKRMLVRGVAGIRTHFRAWLQGAGWKLLYRNWVEMSDPRAGYPRLLALVPVYASLLLLLGFLGAGLVVSGDRRLMPLVFVVFTMSVPHAFLVTEARYSVGARTILYLFSGIALVWLPRRLRGRPLPTTPRTTDRLDP